MTDIEKTLSRIDTVIRTNRRSEYLFLILTTILFGCGISCIVVALVTKEYAWSSPSMITTGLLYWPLNQIKNIRRENISLAVAPMLISSLPPKEAAEEIRNLLKEISGSK